MITHMAVILGRKGHEEARYCCVGDGSTIESDAEKARVWHTAFGAALTLH